MSSELFLQALAPSSGERILDVGAGKGTVAARVMKASGGAEVHAVDPSEKRVASMKRDFPAVRSSVARAEELPFADSYFDKVYSTMALHHFSNLDGALGEISRVLKPGGSFVVVEVAPGSGLGIFFRFFGRVLGEQMRMLTMEELEGKLESAGLKVLGGEGRGSRYLIRASRTRTSSGQSPAGGAT